MRRRLGVSALVLVALAACTAPSGTGPDDAIPEPIPSEHHEQGLTGPMNITCPEPQVPLTVGAPLETEGGTLDFDLLAASVDDPLRMSLDLIAASAGCLETVVVAAVDDPTDLALAGMLALVERLPLILLPGDGSAASLSTADQAVISQALQERDTATVLAVSGDLAWLTTDALVVDDLCAASTSAPACQPDDVAALILERSEAPLDRSESESPAEALINHAASGDPAFADLLRIMLDGPDPDTDMASTVATADVEPSDQPTEPSPPEMRDEATLWLGDLGDPVAAVIAATTAASRDEMFVAVDGGELRAGRHRTETLRASAQRRVVLIGEPGDHTAWQLATVLDGTPLPGGGFLALEDQRIVALYGAPGFPGLGILGQQDLDETIERARAFAEPYGADGRRVVPGFDLIATIASSNAGTHGDYSQRIAIETLRPLVDRARQEGFAVILDLQPGRTSFLDQAMEYEELLREPHVSLALDPEWRIGPREVHLVRIGSVAAEEVQQVADWLADLVRRERLPQKVFMLHQFVGSMLPDRDTIVIPPELIGVIHVDGQGTLRGKYRTYDVMSRDAIDQWEWGWKNFLAIDRPVATPEQVLDVDPLPLVVTYQ